MTIPKQSREVLICVAGLALLGGALGARRYLRPTGVGSVTLEHGIHNFGDVGQGETLAHTFRLTNGWAEPIEIVQAQSSCSCTAAVDLVGRVVAPKAGLDIPLTLKTGSDDGPRTGTVTLYYRSVGATTPPLNYAEVRVAANVVPDYRVRPNLVDFGTVDHTGAITKVIRLRPERLPGVKIIRLDTSSDAFKARRVAAPVGSTDIHIELTFSGRSLWKSGPLNATLFIDTDSRGAARRRHRCSRGSATRPPSRSSRRPSSSARERRGPSGVRSSSAPRGRFGSRESGAHRRSSRSHHTTQRPPRRIAWR